ncbi:transposase [hot springs metagenome]|uniref:Transposase n=1 Tax=hot springs metagenome TaxID=433727 RepID=A0A5J4L029_9ZZZZ
MSFDPAVIAQARIEIANAPHGMKTETAGKWAKILNTTMQTLYRNINPDVNSKRTRKGQPQKPEYQKWARIVYQIKKCPPEEAGEISTEDAVLIAVKSGLIPEAAIDVPIGTYNRIARENGWSKKEVRANRFQAERPNQAHHFDASTSKFFYIAKRFCDGDYLLKLHRPAKHYKNKPVPVDALRPWIYGLTDDYSGRLICRYVAAQGENSVDSMSFLSWAWSIIGLPEQLLADQGMLKKALPSRDLIERLGIELPEMMPYQKRGHGKIERPWRTAWQKFEKPFWAVADQEKFEITLSELNKQLLHFIEDKYNKLPHRFERHITRMQAWSKINLHGGIVTMPENALATVARRCKRKVSVEGKLEYNGKSYEVKGLHSAWVWVFEGVFEDRLIVQDCKTGMKYEVRDFEPLNLGEYKSHKQTPHQELVKESANLNISKDAMLYADKAPRDEKIVAMPIRTKEDREIADPFDVTTYASIDEAMGEFMKIVLSLDPENKEVVKRLILQNGLKKQYVMDLALEIRAIKETKNAAVAGG